MKKQNQTTAVLNYLKTGKALCQEEAYEKIGTQRLGAIIYNLRHKYGFDIYSIKSKGKNRFGNSVNFVKYQLGNTQEQIHNISKAHGLS